ncbi:hypothetical protein [Pelagibacterium sp. H642]|uniref:hypothetical protein n=1 Tax=Pelagibacterium sp. H642 TaxID=1881069 RepID=UPI002815B264|nr:hypothetical protein [Pelagibacterium sp. H642]WMT90115.1 hypothetical protein NO934_15150 [Pelagibacterium sp. H642]
MTKRSTNACQQLMLPLEEFLAGEAARRAPNREPRQVGECLPTSVRDVIERVGQGRREAGGGRVDAPGQFRGGEEETPRKENGKSAEPEGPASFARAANAGGGTIVDFLHSPMLRRHAHSGLVMAVVVLCECLDSGPVHHAGSETWIEF